jgi:lipocalin
MKELNTVNDLSLDKYIGKWFEVARIPNRFERNLICVTAEYQLRNDGKITVINRGHKQEDVKRVRSVRGKAWIPDEKFPGRLKVQFFWPFRGDYQIFHLDREKYRYALVGEPRRKYFWMLHRTPHISESLYDQLIRIAEDNGYDSSHFYRTPQTCD